MLIETVAETDDALLEKYLHGGKVEADEIKAALRRATISGHVQPVICGSAFKNKGVQQLLDAVVDYLPSPLDVPADQGPRRRRGGARAAGLRRRARSRPSSSRS